VDSGRHEADLLEQLAEENGDDRHGDFDEYLHNELLHNEPLPLGFNRALPRCPR
jgi:hypothetical protein